MSFAPSDRIDQPAAAGKSPAHSGKLAVVCAILVTLTLGGSIVALLLYRSITSPQLGRVLVVRANEQWDGVELIVEGGTLVKPKVTWVERLGNYTVPFFLAP